MWRAMWLENTMNQILRIQHLPEADVHHPIPTDIRNLHAHAQHLPPTYPTNPANLLTPPLRPTKQPDPHNAGGTRQEGIYYTYTRSFAYTYTYTYAYTHAHIHRQTQTYTHYTYTHTQTQTHTQTLPHTTE